MYDPRNQPRRPRATMAPALAAQAATQDVTPQRERLAAAILNATGGGEPQPVESPWQAIGNASQQMAAAYLQKKIDQRNQRAKPMPSMWGAPGSAYRPQSLRPKPIPRMNSRTVPPLKPSGG